MTQNFPTTVPCLYYLKYILLTCAVLQLGCSQSCFSEPRSDFPIIRPSRSLSLADALYETSGLAESTSPDTLLTHNDEEGSIFTISKTTGAILNQERLLPAGDYEGIEATGSERWILESNGRLTHLLKNTIQRTYETGLSIDNDAEGLMQDPNNRNIFWIALKGKPYFAQDKITREVVMYSIVEQCLLKVPKISIKLGELRRWVDKNFSKVNAKVLTELKERMTIFAPSGVAVDPTTSRIYVLSAEGSALVSYTADGTLHAIMFFDERRIPKPEGIVFEADGDCWISSEGEDGPARLHYFEANSFR